MDAVTFAMAKSYTDEKIKSTGGATAPVESVNGKTGAVQLSAADVGALPDTYTPPNQTAEQVGADPAGTAESKVSEHNTGTESHADIRLLVQGLTTRLNALANSTDEDLDQMAELVAYTKSNKSLIDAITTSKVSVADIVDNLVTNVGNVPLSAAQGVVLKGLVDALSTGKLDASQLQAAIDTALAQAKASGEFNGADGQDGAPGVDGKDGTSVTVKSVTESTEDGGINVVTFSDGSELAVRNGSKGSDGADEIPAYWQSHLDARVDTIREAMEQAGRNKSAFLFYSDAHWDDGGKTAPMLLKYMSKYTAINKTIFGGDIVNTEPTVDTLSDRSIMRYLWDWRSQVRGLRHYSIIGNHDDGNNNTTTGGATNTIFPIDYVYSFLFAPEEDNRGIVRNADTYYYFDDTRENTRYLCLDTAYESQFALSAEQEAFLKESLKSTPENYHIVAVAHIWYMPDYTQYTLRPVPLTGLSDTAKTVCGILDNYNSRAGEFADCKAKVEFCIGGHIHQDHVGKTDGGIPIVSVETASLQYRGSFPANTGDTTETAVSGIIADYDNDKLSVIRVGRGNSFTVVLSTGATETLPDDSEVPTEPDTPTYTNVLETVGYKEDYRLSGSSGAETQNTGTDISGFIPYSFGQYVYLKDVAWKLNDSGYGGFVGIYLEDKSYKTGFKLTDTQLNSSDYKMEVDANNYVTKIRLNFENVAYIRICALNIDDTSIITINEPIE